MPVSFNEVPADVRVPLTYIEIDNSQAVSGTPAMDYRVLMLGAANPKAHAEGKPPVPITNATVADAFAGAGSQLAGMCKAALKANPNINLWAMSTVQVPYDPVDGYAVDTAEFASGLLEAVLVDTNAAHGAGTFALYIDGVRLAIHVEETDLLSDIAEKLADAIDRNPDCPVRVASARNSFPMALESKYADRSANGIPFAVNYYPDETMPDNLDVGYTDLGFVSLQHNPSQLLMGGFNNSTFDQLAPLITDWYQLVVTAKTSNYWLNSFQQWLHQQWGASVMKPSIGFMALGGSLFGIETVGGPLAEVENFNDFLLTCIMPGISQSSDWTWAAVNAAVAAGSLSRDPARPLQTLTLEGVYPSKVPYGDTARELLLHSGGSTYFVDAGGNARIGRQITTYTTNAYGSPDPSYLDVTTIATLSYIRYAVRTRITQKFPRCKLADDGTRFGPGQAIVTPSIIRAELLALFRELEYQGLVEGFEQYKNSLIVERDANDPNRVNVLAAPDLINQLHIFAEKIQFLL